MLHGPSLSVPVPPKSLELPEPLVRRLCLLFTGVQTDRRKSRRLERLGADICWRQCLLQLLGRCNVLRDRSGPAWRERVELPGP